MKTHSQTSFCSWTRVGILGAALAFVTSATPLKAADVAENWGKYCASCHGKDGKGQTKAGKQSGAKDMTEAAYQDSKKDDTMFKIIKEGLKDRGAVVMKPFEGKLTDDEIKALVAHVRAFKK